MAELYAVFAPVIYGQVLMPKVLDESMAEDVLADTFVTAFGMLDKFESRGLSMFFWLARIASNKLTDVYRKNARAEKASREMERLLRPLLDKQDQQDTEIIRLLDSEGLRKRIRRVLKLIRPRYAKALELRFIQGLDRKECARRLELKIGTFDVLLLRSLRAFRKEWIHEP